MAKLRLKTIRPDRRHARKVTVIISAENDLRLTVAAKARNVDRSCYLDGLLTRHLRGITVQVPADLDGSDRD